jgi:chemosensory pili system protein ChpA (sensor histidine kinase/response regulator)
LNYAAIDLASLSWLLPELDSTLKVARTHLAAAQQSSGDEALTNLRDAKRAIHDAAGALQLIDAQGVVHILEVFEKVIDHCSEVGQLDLDAFNVLDKAAFSIIAYLSELRMTRVLLQPVVLYPAYEALCSLYPEQDIVTNCHPADLYFPNLNACLEQPPESATSVSAAPAMDLQKIRSAYEVLLLQVLKRVASQRDINNLSMLLGLVANGTNQPHAYSFWKSCQAVVQTLNPSNGELDVGLKKWLGRLNLQIQRLAGGSNHLSERLLREALFYIASIKGVEHSTNPLLSQIAQCYQLAESVPDNLKQSRYGEATPATASVLLDKVNAFKQAWDEAAPETNDKEDSVLPEGILLRRLRTALQKAMDLQLSLSEHHLPVLVSVAKAVSQAATTASEANTPLHKTLGLEGAKAILWIEETIKRPGQTQAAQLLVSHSIISRVQESAQSDQALPASLDLSVHHTQLLMGDVIREAMVGLSTVEKQLDDYFRFNQDPSTLNETLEPLAQSSSTLEMLGLPQASLAITAIEQRIKGFIAQPSSGTQDAFSSLAVQFSQVTALLDLFTRSPDHAQKDYLFDPVSGELKNQLELMPRAGKSAFDSLESLSQQRRVDAKALVKEVAAKPDDATARTALVESLKALKDDAALTGDVSLSALATVDLSPVSILAPDPDLTSNTSGLAALRAMQKRWLNSMPCSQPNLLRCLLLRQSRILKTSYTAFSWKKPTACLVTPNNCSRGWSRSPRLYPY